MSSTFLSFFFEVEDGGTYTGVPIIQRSRNDLDSHGSLLDLVRLPSEDGVSYYQRLVSVIPQRASSTGPGLVHGITRELGLEELTALIISPTMSNGKTVAPAPFVEVTATEVILYSSYTDANNSANVVDRQIDIFSHGDGYLLDDLVIEIQQSPYFVASLGDYATGQEKSNGLLPTSSCDVVEKEWVPSGTYFFLANQDIVPGTLSFSETTIFDKELSAGIATGATGDSFTLSFIVSTPVTARGEYYVDYIRAVVSCYSASSGYGTCRYKYRKFPLRIRWSPIVVYSLRDINYRTKVFETESMPDFLDKEGLVSEEGKAVYDQVFDKSPCLWGR
jgi:hypothetical protein